MASWLERYLSGEYERVWWEMLACGDAIRPTPPSQPRADQLQFAINLNAYTDELREQRWQDAIAVARETMRRARANIETLIVRLREIEYVFEDPKWLFIPPTPDDIDRLHTIERRIGPLPLSIRAWYGEVGGVSLRGEHPRLTRFMWDWARKNSTFPDPLEYICPPDYILELYAEWKSEPVHHRRSNTFIIDFSADDYHKAGFSGGPSYRIALPDASADTPIHEIWYHTLFVPYLRRAFAWGGFPGFADYPDYPREEIAFLTAGLLLL